jgi:hypothetical protein
VTSQGLVHLGSARRFLQRLEALPRHPLDATRFGVSFRSMTLSITPGLLPSCHPRITRRRQLCGSDMAGSPETCHWTAISSQWPAGLRG